MAFDDDVNPYELLELQVECTEQEIRSAYRQRSLKVHPDRNRNNPDAARKFHELNQAYELLVDPLRRLALDAKLRLKEAQKARVGKYSVKRKALVEELEERERAFKKAKEGGGMDKRQRAEETERIQAEGRRLREEKERELERAVAEERKDQEMGESELAPPVLGIHDTTVCLKYTLAFHPSLTTPDALATLLRPFGEIDTESIVLSLKPPKNKKKAQQQQTAAAKNGTALVPFKKIGDAFGAVCASGRADRGLGGIEVGWAEGKEPPILAWLRKLGKLGTSSVSTASGGDRTVPPPRQAEGNADGTSPSPFASFPESIPDPPRMSTSQAPLGGIDYESLTLMRLRQAERERLEREIREQEDADS